MSNTMEARKMNNHLILYGHQWDSPIPGDRTGFPESQWTIRNASISEQSVYFVRFSSKNSDIINNSRSSSNSNSNEIPKQLKCKCLHI